MQINQTTSANKAYKAYCQSLSDPSTAVSFKQWLINQKTKSNTQSTSDETEGGTEKINFYNADAAANAPTTSVRIMGMPIVVAVPVLIVAGYAAFRVIKYFVNRNKTATA